MSPFSFSPRSGCLLLIVSTFAAGCGGDARPGVFEVTAEEDKTRGVGGSMNKPVNLTGGSDGVGPLPAASGGSPAMGSGAAMGSGGATSDPQLPAYSLGHVVIDAEFERGSGLIYYVRAQPNQLVRYNPRTNATSTVDLPTSPTSVGLKKDGTEAVVGYDGWISHIDLSSMSMLNTFGVTTKAFDVLLPDTGYAHAFPTTDQWEDIRSINLETGEETLSTGYSIRAGTQPRLHPDGLRAYGADNGLSPSDIERYDLSAGTAVLEYDSPYHGDYAVCGDLWINQPGTMTLTACGNAFSLAELEADDLQYSGSVERDSENYYYFRIHSAHHSTASKSFVTLVTETEYFSDPGPLSLRAYDETYLHELGRLNVLCDIASCDERRREFVFVDETAQRVHVIFAVGTLSYLMSYDLAELSIGQ